MASNTQYSFQAAVNRIAGNADTAKHQDNVYNTANGSTGKTVQQILAANLSFNPTAKSTQELLYTHLKTPLSLTRPWTEYSEQVLANLALGAATTLTVMIGK